MPSGAGSSVPWCGLETIVSKAVLWRFVGAVVRELAINRLINCACQFRDISLVFCLDSNPQLWSISISACAVPSQILELSNHIGNSLDLSTSCVHHNPRVVLVWFVVAALVSASFCPFFSPSVPGHLSVVAGSRLMITLVPAEGRGPCGRHRPVPRQKAATGLIRCQ